jgi:hypothetical protein
MSNIKTHFNHFARGCKEHNPFANLPYAPKVNPAVKVACLLPMIGNLVSTITGLRFESKAGLYPSGEAYRARRRLVHFEVAGAVATIAAATAFVALGIFTPMGLICTGGFAALTIAYCVYQYVSLHKKIQRANMPGNQAPQAAPLKRPEVEIVEIAQKYQVEVSKEAMDAVQSKNASNEEKKAALRKVIRTLQLKLHPDKTIGLGEEESKRREEDVKVVRDAEVNLS